MRMEKEKITAFVIRGRLNMLVFDEITEELVLIDLKKQRIVARSRDANLLFLGIEQAGGKQVKAFASMED